MLQICFSKQAESQSQTDQCLLWKIAFRRRCEKIGSNEIGSTKAQLAQETKLVGYFLFTTYRHKSRKIEHQLIECTYRLDQLILYLSARDWRTFLNHQCDRRPIPKIAIFSSGTNKRIVKSPFSVSFPLLWCNPCDTMVKRARCARDEIRNCPKSPKLVEPSQSLQKNKTNTGQ